MEQTKETHAPKKISFPVWIGIVLGVAILLYVAGWIVTRCTKLEYRRWAYGIGNLLIYMGIPLWGICMAIGWMRKNVARRIVTVLATGVLGVVFVAWSFLFLLFLVFSMRMEVKLPGKYLAVDVAAWLQDSEWEYYEPKWWFFRQPSDKLEAEQWYLEEKYQEPFEWKAWDRMKEDMGDRYWAYGDKAWFSESHPDIPVYVWLRSSGTEDNYVTRVAQAAFCRAYEEMEISEIKISEMEISEIKISEISTDYFWETGRFYLVLRENEIERFCRDVKFLLETVEKDFLFQEWKGALNYKVEINGEKYYGSSFGFGAESGQGEKYYLREDILREMAEESILAAKEKDAKRKAAELEREERKEQQKQQEQKSESLEEIYRQEAEEIYRNFVEPQSMGTGFEVCYNAKGFPYYDLGADGNFAYTLVYDRNSANGACRLYVLYKSPRAESREGYVGYTDDGTRIEDVYAYVKDSGEIIASGRKKWADAGTEEYRRATGE